MNLFKIKYSVFENGCFVNKVFEVMANDLSHALQLLRAAQ